MSITKNIIDEHQAEIWIESIPDKTTTVFLKFYIKRRILHFWERKEIFRYVL